jgi:uncharacterized protein (TIGR00725 family)
MQRPPQLSVIGAGDAGAGEMALATRVGREIARAGCVLVCGGLGGVMEGACRGAREAGGRTVAILPGPDASAANPWAEVVIPTGLGHARNLLVVQSGIAVLALPGSWGTLSEIALARKIGRPVVDLGGWSYVEGLARAGSPAEAVSLALRLAGCER